MMKNKKNLVSIVCVFMAVLMVFANISLPVGALSDELVSDSTAQLITKPEDKIDSVLKEKMATASPDEKIPVAIWYNDVNQEEIDALTIQKVGYTQEEIAVDYEMPSAELLNDLKADEDGADAEMQAYMARTQQQREKERQRTDEYIMTRREFSREKYNEKSAEIVKSIGLEESNITYKSRYSPTILAELNPCQITEISKNVEVEEIYYTEELICDEDVTGSTSIFDNIILAKDAIRYSDVVDFYSNLGIHINGNGVTIGVAENGGMLQECSEIDQSSVEALEGLTINNNNPNHATNVTRLIVGSDSGFAKGAHVINSNLTQNHWEQLIDMGTKIINMSFSSGDANSRYNYYAKLCDHYVSHSSIIIVASVCNSVSIRRIYSPALAFNVIAVGTYNLGDGQSTPSIEDDIMTDLCGYENVGFAEKPDVLLPCGSTSHATPVLASCIALALQFKPALAVYPQAIKAIVMASCHRKVLPAYESDGTEFMSDGITEYQGAGVFDLWTMFTIISQGTYGVGRISGSSIQGIRRFVLPANTSQTPTNMNISVAWLKEQKNDVVGISSTDTDIVNLDLRVYRNNELVGSSLIGSVDGTDNRISSAEMAYIPLTNSECNYEIRIQKAETYNEVVRYGYAYSMDSSYISTEEGENGIYYIRNYYSDKYLTLNDNNETVMSNFTGADNQKWVVCGTPGNYELQPAYGAVGTRINFGAQVGSNPYYKAVAGTNNLKLNITSWEDDTTLEPDAYIFTMTSEGRSNILSYTSTTGVFVRSTTEPVVNMYRMWVLEDINYRIGDVDRSGSITIKDVTAIEKYLAGLNEFKNIDLYLADYNQDGAVSIKDVTDIEKIL